MAPYCAFRRRILKTRWSFCFKTTLTRRRHFIGECSTNMLRASLAKPVKPQTNLTFPAYLVGRLDLTRFSIKRNLFISIGVANLMFYLLSFYLYTAYK